MLKYIRVLKLERLRIGSPVLFTIFSKIFKHLVISSDDETVRGNRSSEWLLGTPFSCYETRTHKLVPANWHSPKSSVLLVIDCVSDSWYSCCISVSVHFWVRVVWIYCNTFHTTSVILFYSKLLGKPAIQYIQHHSKFNRLHVHDIGSPSTGPWTSWLHRVLKKRCIRLISFGDTMHLRVLPYVDFCPVLHVSDMTPSLHSTKLRYRALGHQLLTGF